MIIEKDKTAKHRRTLTKLLVELGFAIGSKNGNLITETLKKYNEAEDMAKKYIDIEIYRQGLTDFQDKYSKKQK
ncbi:MAG: hypothetical protein ABFQ65_01030 [Nanoarchaeota archaeon]